MAAKNPAFLASSVSLIDVRIIEGRIESNEEFEARQIIAYDPECSLRIFLDLTKNLIRGELKVWVDTESDPSQHEAHAHFHFNFYFRVSELGSWVEESPEGSVQMDAGLQNAVASVSYSTARGILLSRFQGTVFARFILPVINPNDLLEKSSKPRRKKNASKPA